MAIPEGKKCFAWFSIFNNRNVCFIMELNNYNEIDDIKIVNACFTNELSYGTIVYGTMLYYSNNNFFFLEDIFFYKGNEIYKKNWGEKLVIIKDLLQNNLKQVSFNNSFLVFGLPIMAKTNEEIENMIQQNIKYNLMVHLPYISHSHSDFQSSQLRTCDKNKMHYYKSKIKKQTNKNLTKIH